jgi:hypothetical protein
MKEKNVCLFSFLEKDLSNSISRLFLFSSSSLVRLDKTKTDEKQNEETYWEKRMNKTTEKQNSFFFSIYMQMI